MIFSLRRPFWLAADPKRWISVTARRGLHRRAAFGCGPPSVGCVHVRPTALRRRDQVDVCRLGVDSVPRSSEEAVTRAVLNYTINTFITNPTNMNAAAIRPQRQVVNR